MNKSVLLMAIFLASCSKMSGATDANKSEVVSFRVLKSENILNSGFQFGREMVRLSLVDKSTISVDWKNPSIPDLSPIFLRSISNGVISSFLYEFGDKKRQFIFSVLPHAQDFTYVSIFSGERYCSCEKDCSLFCVLKLSTNSMFLVFKSESVRIRSHGWMIPQDISSFGSTYRIPSASNSIVGGYMIGMVDGNPLFGEIEIPFLMTFKERVELSFSFSSNYLDGLFEYKFIANSPAVGSFENWVNWEHFVKSGLARKYYFDESNASFGDLWSFPRQKR